MFKNKLGEDSPIPECMHVTSRRRHGVESLTTLEEGEFKVPIDGCITEAIFHHRQHYGITRGKKHHKMFKKGKISKYWVLVFCNKDVKIK